MDAGYGQRLMKDMWGDIDNGNTQVLCPANPGYEGRESPAYFDHERDDMITMLLSVIEMPKLRTGCIFLENDLCILHDQGLKPTEGQLTCCKRDHGDLHEDIAKLWNSDEGRAAVARWDAKP
jgi:hypothetical protein